MLCIDIVTSDGYFDLGDVNPAGLILVIVGAPGIIGREPAEGMWLALLVNPVILAADPKGAAGLNVWSCGITFKEFEVGNGAFCSLFSMDIMWDIWFIWREGTDTDGGTPC